ncbi:peroxidase family protein [Humitalea sp. 24SJ18S-53]|uniref:peroxidase family protein n=1 Tax=Humitalea sp. 24SJ18S-53 TaxID=3422307 RepID=UPI003D677F41
MPQAKTVSPVEGGHGHGPRHDYVPPLGSGFIAGRFGRLWPEMTDPLLPSDAALDALGLAMSEVSKPSTDNANIPAGYTYLGQFIDHDITLDTTSLDEIAVDPSALVNFRTPSLDLDSIYGLGPKVQPSLYDRDSPGRASLLLGRTSPAFAPPGAPPGPDFVGLPHDLPRNHQGLALIGDERNDENLLVAQTHVAMLRFHNAIAAKLAGSVPDSGLFDAARRATVDLYQAMVLRDFLSKLCDVNDIAAAVDKRRFFRFEEFGAYGPYMPVEFSAAAYRLGHSMVRSVYSHNRIFRPNNAPAPPASFDLLFLFTAKSGQIGQVPGPTPANKPTLPGDWIIDWRRFLDFGTTDTSDGFVLNLSRGIDPFLAKDLHMLPSKGFSPTSPTAASSLAVMNLRRGRKMLLPAGQDLARFMGVAVLTPDQVASGPDGAVAKAHGLHTRTPLWYYILKEAEVVEQGNRLGPLGSLIVAEVFVGLLQGDKTSILGRNPGWRFGQPLPGMVLPGADVKFTFADLVAVSAGVLPGDDAATKKTKLSPVG